MIHQHWLNRDWKLFEEVKANRLNNNEIVEEKYMLITVSPPTVVPKKWKRLKIV